MSENLEATRKLRAGALAVVAANNFAKGSGSKSVLKRQLSKDPSAMDVLNTFVDESLENSPMTTLARNKCAIPDALLMEGDSFETQMESNICREAPYVSRVKQIRSIFPTHTSERRKRIQEVCHKIRRNDGTIVKCRLSSEHIDDSMIRMLCAALPNNTKLLALQLLNNRITDDGVLTLSRSLKRHPNFNTLWLGGNRITDQGVYYLCDLLKKNPRITDLNISNKWPELRWEQTEHNSHPHISDHGAVLLGELMRTTAETRGSGGLKNLCLAEQRVADIGASALFAAIPYSNLRTLNLKDNNITDKCCESLNVLLQSSGGICHLEVLVLAKNNITEAGLCQFLPGLEMNRSLHALDLSYNDINLSGMRALKDCLLDNQGLQGISLIGNTSEDDHGCEAFLKARVLMQVSMDISENKDFFDQFKAYDIKNIDARAPDVAKLILEDLTSDVGIHGHPLPSRSVRLDSPSPLNPFGSVACLHGKDNLEEQRLALETRQQEELETANTTHGMAARLGRAPRTPKPQTPNPVPAHKFLKRLSTQDMTASFRSSMSMGGETTRRDDDDDDDEDEDDFFKWEPGLSPRELHASEVTRSHDSFSDVMVQHQYSNDDDVSGSSESITDPFATTKREMLIDNDGFPLIPGSSPKPSPSSVKKPKLLKQNSWQSKIGEDEDDDDSTKAKLHDSIENYTIPLREDIKPAREVGKTIGIPYVGVVVGSKPVRSHTTRHADSAQHLQYSKILTAADPPGTAPYSWVKIGADRRNEIAKVKAIRQTPQYKIQKRNAQIYNRVYGMRATMKHLPPRRFWDEWTSTVNQKYPDGIDQAPGCVSVPMLTAKEDPSMLQENKQLARRREMAQLYGFVETKEMAMKKQKEIYQENKKHSQHLEMLEKERINSDKNARRDKRLKNKTLNEKFHAHAAVGGNAAAAALSGSHASINVNTLIGCKGGQSVGDKFIADSKGGKKGLTFN